MLPCQSSTGKENVPFVHRCDQTFVWEKNVGHILFSLLKAFLPSLGDLKKSHLLKHSSSWSKRDSAKFGMCLYMKHTSQVCTDAVAGVQRATLGIPKGIGRSSRIVAFPSLFKHCFWNYIPFQERVGMLCTMQSCCWKHPVQNVTFEACRTCWAPPWIPASSSLCAQHSTTFHSNTQRKGVVAIGGYSQHTWKGSNDSNVN